MQSTVGVSATIHGEQTRAVTRPKAIWISRIAFIKGSLPMSIQSAHLRLRLLHCIIANVERVLRVWNMHLLRLLLYSITITTDNSVIIYCLELLCFNGDARAYISTRRTRCQWFCVWMRHRTRHYICRFAVISCGYAQKTFAGDATTTVTWLWLSCNLQKER